MLDYVTIGSRLKAARLAQGSSQEQVARRLDMSRQNVSLIEKGQPTSLANIARYAESVKLPFVIDMGDGSDDTRVALLARLQRVIRDLDGPVFDLLLGMVERWEEHDDVAARHAAGR